jgi:hypothetical protein
MKGYRKDLLLFLFALSKNIAARQIRVIVAGLDHDHVHGILNQYNKGIVKFHSDLLTAKNFIY